MNKEHHNENKNDEEDTLTLAKLFSNWYVGAVVGFALGTLKGDLTTESIGFVIGATVSWIFKKCLMSKK
jgi:predicted branched-subunit amino acid permease